jgi:hypothetical protein
MLTALDESLHHQGAATFNHVLTSDHRFYDRQLLTGFKRDGSAGFMAGITLFKNMNVVEGYLMAQNGTDRQYNIRFTKELRPMAMGMSAEIGPLRLDIIEPYKELRMVLDKGDYPVTMDMTFHGVIPAGLQNHHFGRLDGRISQDYMRYHQVGRGAGTMAIDGKHFDDDNWMAWRDHSWGVRPGVGGFEPYTGTRTPGGVASAAQTGDRGLFLIYFGFSNGKQAGDIQIKEDGNGERYFLDGEVYNIGDDIPLRVVDASHKLNFYPGTRLFKTVTLEMDLANGETWTINARDIGKPWVFCGGGMDGGFNDGLGQGVYRSRELLTEIDVYDTSDVEKVGFPDGSIRFPKHREQITECEINGVLGHAYVPTFVIGNQPRFGLPPR